MKKLIASALSAFVVAAFVAVTPLAANAAEECVPSDAIPGYTEVVPDIEHPAVGEPTISVDNPDYIPAVPASTKWWDFAPNRGQGPLEGAPTFPSDERGTWVGPHTNGGPGQDQTGVYQQGNGHGSWFYRENTPEQPAVGEPTLEVPNPDYVAPWGEVTPDIWHEPVDAVTCEEDPEEPTTYTPSCTTVTEAAFIEGDGVLAVAGGWAVSFISVPFSGTLADIGTVFDVTATQTQYLGIHIDTAEGTIVFEEEPSYNGTLWSNVAWEGVPSTYYPAQGTAEQYIHLNGDVAVTGIRLLYTHPEASSTTVESFTVGCTVYTFFTEPVIEEPPVEEPGPVTVPPTTTPPTPAPAAPVPTAITPAPVVATPALAETGGTDLRPLAFGGALALLAGLVALVVIGVRRRTTK